MSPTAVNDSLNSSEPTSRPFDDLYSCDDNVSKAPEQDKEGINGQTGMGPSKPQDEHLRATVDVVPDGKYAQSRWDATSELTVNGPFNYLLGKPGKNVRTELLRAFNFWLQVDESSFRTVDRVISMLHNASLLIDDIQDDSQLRRGAPVAHRVFGCAQTINSANYVYFLAQQELLGLPNWPEALRIYSEELLNLHRGQGMEIFWRDTLTVPTETEYFDMISKKTGALFCLGARLLQSLSSTNVDLMPLAYLLGLIFQICDDYKNLFSDCMTNAKGYCEDLTEGKFSFPILHAIRSSSSPNNDVLNILRLHTKDAELKAHAVWYMRTQSRSKDYTALVVRDFYDKARKLMEAMASENDLLKKIIHKIVDDCCEAMPVRLPRQLASGLGKSSKPRDHSIKVDMQDIMRASPITLTHQSNRIDMQHADHLNAYASLCTIDRIDMQDDDHLSAYAILCTIDRADMQDADHLKSAGMPTGVGKKALGLLAKMYDMPSSPVALKLSYTRVLDAASVYNVHDANSNDMQYLNTRLQSM